MLQLTGYLILCAALFAATILRPERGMQREAWLLGWVLSFVWGALLLTVLATVLR